MEKLERIVGKSIEAGKETISTCIYYDIDSCIDLLNNFKSLGASTVEFEIVERYDSTEILMTAHKYYSETDEEYEERVRQSNERLRLDEERYMKQEKELYIKLKEKYEK